jgi:hypothetical protein
MRTRALPLLMLLLGCEGSVGKIELPTECSSCPVPRHAAVTCEAGACGRGACDAGYFDFDGAETFGCEAECVGLSCRRADGTTVVLTSPALPESGIRDGAFASSAVVQTSARYRHTGVLGDARLGGGR